MGGMPYGSDKMGITLITRPITGNQADSAFYEVRTNRFSPFFPDIIYERSGGKYWNSKTGKWDTTQNFEELREEWNNPDATLINTNYKLGPIKDEGIIRKMPTIEEVSQYDLPQQKGQFYIKSNGTILKFNNR